MRWLELRIPPLLVVVAFALAMFAAARVAPALSLPLPGRGVIAAVLLALGIAVAATGVATFRKAGTTVNPLTPGESSTVVATGVYRVSRNPMYLGFLAALAGWAAWLANAGAALLLPLFVAYMTRFQILPEERALHAKFGPAFERYRSSVRRWL